MGKVRICMIGAGMMANKVHYPSLASFENVDMVGICDLDEQKMKKTAMRSTMYEVFLEIR